MMNAEQRRRLWLELLTLACFCAFLFYFGLGSFGLVGADEPRYAQIAREMFERRDWVTPVLHGRPWLEKPVLYYWLAIFSYKLFGVSDWAARIPSAFCASAMIAGIYAFMRRFASAVAMDAALATASCAACIGFARAASTDMPLAATFMLAMLAWYRAFHSRPGEAQGGSAGETDSGTQAPDHLWLAAAYVALALATLAKGPVAPVLALAIVVLFAALRRDLNLIRGTLWVPGIVLYIVIALPWYLAVQHTTGSFFREFFLEHNLARFATNVYRHKQPFWYYLPVLLLSLAPWMVFSVAAFVGTLRRRLSGDLPIFLALWGCVPVVFFSISQSKLPGYILPAIPAWTLLLACLLQDRLPQRCKPRMVLLLLHAAVAAVMLSAALLLPWFLLRTPAPHRLVVIAGAVAGALFIAIALSLSRQGFRALRFVTLVPAVVAVGFALRAGSATVDATRSARPVAREIAALTPKAAPVAVLHVRRDLEFGLGFYRNAEIPSYDRGEIPAAGHLVVAPAGSKPAIAEIAPGRHVSLVGDFSWQKLEFYWVSRPAITPK
jgi:4-amino-4-deoxy-L-arabinose transferase-like glycosyltransferase